MEHHGSNNCLRYDWDRADPKDMACVEVGSTTMKGATMRIPEILRLPADDEVIQSFSHSAAARISLHCQFCTLTTQSLR